MKKILITILLVAGAATASQAQKYRTAAGIRLGGDQFGATVQQRIAEKSTLEGLALVGSREYSGTLLYQRHWPMLGKRFNYYLGGGGHIGNLKDHGVFTGLDAIVGVEYKVNGLPFLLSADVKPALHFNHEDWVKLATGISIRYVIVPEKKEKKKVWPFGKQQEEEEKSGWPFGKKKEPEPPKKKAWPFGKKEEPAPEPEPEKRIDWNKIFKKQEN
ncbi:hypothetical protein [Pontibacter virosus]|uniref:Outer membrane protein with beta-barrel domain n=1 Tax=Pontibacter virosus TaxID=1765052 RepID=A0A2U1AU61_9BACT|nr:hypothetical protein [Pontibacter virosus]PVY39958.1 hypothetical protein C8E01_109102 [Pontibacter virosus]